jgi:hypothetical protein
MEPRILLLVHCFGQRRPLATALPVDDVFDPAKRVPTALVALDAVSKRTS